MDEFFMALFTIHMNYMSYDHMCSQIVFFSITYNHVHIYVCVHTCVYVHLVS